MKNRFHPALFVFLTGLLVVAGCSRNSDDSNKRLHAYTSQAEAFLSSGQYRAVLIEAQNILALSPKEETGYLYIARSYNELGLYKQAISALEQLPDSTSTSPQFQLVLANAYNGAQKFRSALGVLTSIDKNNASLPENRQIQLETARAYSGLSEYNNASKIYNALLSDNSKDAGAILGLAEIAFRKNQMAESERLITTMPASHIYPVQVQVLLARLKARSNDLASAEAHLTEALGVSKQTDMMSREKATILNALSEVLIKQGRSAEALVYTQLLAEAFPGYELAQTNYRKALELFRDGDVEQANTILTELVQNYPGFEDAGRLLAVLQYQSGDYSAAAENLNALVDPELASADVTLLTAASNLKSNQPDKVVELLRNAPALNSDMRLLAVYGSALIETGNQEAGVSALQKVLTKEPENIEVLSALVSYYLSNTAIDITPALQYAEAANKASPANVEIATLYSSLLVRDDSIDRARDIVKYLLTQNNSGEAQLLAGKLAFLLNEWSAAQQHFNKALNVDPQLYSAAIGLGAVAERRAEPYAQLVRAYKKAIEIAPERPNAYQRLVSLATRSDSRSAAVEDMEKLIISLQKQYNETTGYIVLANYYSAQGNIVKAEQLLADASNANAEPDLLDRAKTSLHIARAHAARQDNDITTAKEQLFNALKLQPRSPTLLGMLVELEIETDDFAEASNIIRRIRSLDENLALALEAYSLEKQENTEQAIALYRKLWNQSPSDTTASRLFNLLEHQQRGNNISFARNWLAAYPQSIGANRSVSNTLITLGKFDEAITLLEKLNALQPDNATTLNNLAWLYQETGRPLALKFAEQAFSLAPDNAQILDTYGWILLKNKQVHKAVEVLQKAYKLAPQNADIEQHLREAKQQL